MNEREFQEVVFRKGRELYRDMPWRRDTRPYYVLVSELMLQQTQVDRVVPKFLAFIERFPSESELAEAPLAEVLKLWNGLGYNRRAKFLHEAAKTIIQEYGGVFSSNYTDLVELPGIGPNTAGAILAYAFNQPAIFIETNVRTVFFHHFFADADQVDDREIRELLGCVIDKENPREFYWALMDYGRWLKRSGAGRIRVSKHYKKQGPLKGSVREVRGQIIRQLASGDLSETELRMTLTADERFDAALKGLLADGLVMQTKNILHLTK